MDKLIGGLKSKQSLLGVDFDYTMHPKEIPSQLKTYSVTKHQI